MNYPPSCRWMRNPKLWTMFAKTITNQPIPLKTTKDGFSKGILSQTGFEKSVLLSLNVILTLKQLQTFVKSMCGKKSNGKTCDQPNKILLVTSTRRQLLRSSGDTATGPRWDFFCEMVGISLRLRLHVRNGHRPGCTYSSWVQALRLFLDHVGGIRVLSVFLVHLLHFLVVPWSKKATSIPLIYQPKISQILRNGQEFVLHHITITGFSNMQGERWG